MASLIVWMNGERVGEWGSLRGGTPFFRYERSWVESSHARALSLSLPLTADLEVRGPQVANYFDNLLPDSAVIRRRIRVRYKTVSTEAFDLLTAIGRDCVGAVQLLPPGQEPVGWDRVDAAPLTEKAVERILKDVTVAKPLGHDDAEEFRISLAGAQEKTALLGMAGGWFKPRGATPTTHILKLPLGRIGGFQGDFSDSIENEWLCGQLLRTWGFSVADVEMASFGEQRALIVTRFDRRWIGTDEAAVAKKRFAPTKGVWVARLPQEDFCQATGRPLTEKYEADGGPSIEDCLALLAQGEDWWTDQSQFVLAQLAFWLLAATDGHAKNFSLRSHVGGTYRMTPLYDVLSAWPIIGHGKNQLAYEKAKLAMAVRGNRLHYRLQEITGRYWQELEMRTSLRGLWERMLQLVEQSDAAFDQVEKGLPAKVPERVFDTVRAGVRRQAKRFTATLARKGKSRA